jgi:3-dehydroquinate dehydratase-2
MNIVGGDMADLPEILVLNGPNLNMLGVREPHIYGHDTLQDVEDMCRAHAETLGMAVDCQQNNIEGEMVSIIQLARSRAAGIIINPAAYTHTSVAIHDALRLAELPVVEIHLSNTHHREEFRHLSYVSPVAKGVIMGFGTFGYIMALDAMARIIDEA